MKEYTILYRDTKNNFTIGICELKLLIINDIIHKNIFLASDFFKSEIKINLFLEDNVINLFLSEDINNIKLGKEIIKQKIEKLNG